MQEIRSSKEVQNYKVVSFTKKRYLNTFTQNGVKLLLCPSVPPNFQLFEFEICQEKKHPGVGTATGSARHISYQMTTYVMFMVRIWK